MQQGNSGPSSSSENTLQKMFITIDGISKIVKDSDSGSGSFSEFFDRQQYMQSKFTLQQQQQQRRGSCQPKPGRGRKRTYGVIPNHIYTDYELGRKEQIHTTQKPVFPAVPRKNKNFHGQKKKIRTIQKLVFSVVPRKNKNFCITI